MRPSKRLRVSLSGRDAVGAFTLQSTYRLDPSDPGYASELAAVVSLGILEGRWKAIRAQGSEAAPASGDSDLLIAVEFRGMSEWQDISRKLAATPGVEALEVAGLSARGARVTLRYAEGALKACRSAGKPRPRAAQCGGQLDAGSPITPSRLRSRLAVKISSHDRTTPPTDPTLVRPRAYCRRPWHWNMAPAASKPSDRL